MTNLEQRVETPISPASPPDFVQKRLKYAHLLSSKHVLPYEITHIGEAPTTNPFERAEELMKEGYGIILMINHIKKSDPILAMEVTFNESEMFRSARVAAPTAAHQMVPGINRAGDALNVNIAPIFTAHAKERMKKPRLKRAATLFKHKIINPARGIAFDSDTYRNEIKRPITRREEAEALINFRNVTVDTLENGGFVVIAPQGERQAQFSKPEPNPIESLVNVARKRGVTKIAFLPMGIGTKDVMKYEIKGYERGKISTIKIGRCMTLEEQDNEIAERQAKGEKITLGDLNHELLAAVVPKESLNGLNVNNL